MTSVPQRDPLEAEAEAAIAADDPAQLVLLPIRVSLHHDDLAWATSICLRLARHPDPTVRGNAVLGFGHLARRFRTLDETVRPVIEAALLEREPWVAGHARSAADDVRYFLGWDLPIGTVVDRVLWVGLAAERTWRARHHDWVPPGGPAPTRWPLTIETTDEQPTQTVACFWSPGTQTLSADLPEWSATARQNLESALAGWPPPRLHGDER